MNVILSGNVLLCLHVSLEHCGSQSTTQRVESLTTVSFVFNWHVVRGEIFETAISNCGFIYLCVSILIGMN